MQYLPQSRNVSYLAAIFLGAVLLSSMPLGVFGSGGSQKVITDTTPNSLLRANLANDTGTVQVNFAGTGGNDTFVLIAGNGSVIFLATGLGANRFNISSGNGNSTFSMSSGAHSNFTIFQQNVNGTFDAESNPIRASFQLFVITGGANSVLNETSIGPLGNTVYSVNLGSNSTVSLASDFVGNQTAINILF